MKHRHAMRKLGRTGSHRWAMLRTMVSQLVMHERIETTTAKAKELRRVSDNMVQLAKEGTLHARRQAGAVVRGSEPLQKLFYELADRYSGRAGGYTRVLPSRIRTSDAAPMSYIELVDRPDELRPSKPGVPSGPQGNPLTPWQRSSLSRCWAPIAFSSRKTSPSSSSTTNPNPKSQPPSGLDEP